MTSEINNYISDMFVEMASRISKLEAVETTPRICELESKVAKLEKELSKSKK